MKNIKRSCDNFWGWLTLITVPFTILMMLLIAPIVGLIGIVVSVMVYLVFAPFWVIDKIIKFIKRNDKKAEPKND